MNWALSAYARCTTALIHGADAQEVLEKVCQAVVEESPYKLAAVGLAKTSKGLPVEFAAVAGPAASYIKGLNLSWSADEPMGQGPTGQALRSGEPYLVRDLESDPVFAPWRQRAKKAGVRSCVSLPFRRGETLGIFTVFAAEADAFGENEISLFTHLGNELAFALEVDRDRQRLAQAEAQSAASEAQYETLFLNALSGIVVADAEGRYLDANPAMCALLGYERDDLIGRGSLELLDKAQAGHLRKALEEISATGRHRSEWRFHRKDGAIFVADVSATILPDGNLLGIVRDVSDERAAEAERLLSERRYRNLFDHGYDGIIVVNPDRVVLDVNPKACTMLGYKRRDLVGKPGPGLLDPPQWDDFRARALATPLGRSFQGAWRLKHKDGHQLTTETVTTRLPNNEFVAIIRDLTENERAEAARRQSDQRYRGLFDHAQDGIILLTPNGIYADINPSALAMLGYDRDAFIGRPGPDILAPEDLIAFVRAGEEIRAHGDYRAAWRLRHRDGHFIPTEAISTLLPDGSYVSIVRDMTQAIANEEARRAAQEHLSATQAALTRVGRASTLGEVVTTIAHEVNQPLAAIETNSDAATRWLRKTPPNLDEVKSALGCIVRDSRRASDVIQRTRSFLSGGEAQKSLFDLNGALEEVLALSSAEQSRANVKVHLSLAPNLPKVPADRTQIQQVALNLILNAIEAMSDVDDRSRALFVATSRSKSDEVLAKFEDRGLGLDAGKATHLFEQFFTTKNGGMGMGLAISRTIIAAHGGRIWASPAPIHGAIFQFTLPLESPGGV